MRIITMKDFISQAKEQFNKFEKKIKDESLKAAKKYGYEKEYHHTLDKVIELKKDLLHKGGVLKDELVVQSKKIADEALEEVKKEISVFQTKLKQASEEVKSEVKKEAKSAAKSASETMSKASKKAEHDFQDFQQEVKKSVKKVVEQADKTAKDFSKKASKVTASATKTVKKVVKKKAHEAVDKIDELIK